MKTQITVSKKKNATHITGNSGTSCATIACVCVYVLTVYVEMGLPGKTIETLEQNHNINQGWAAREHYIPYND